METMGDAVYHPTFSDLLSHLSHTVQDHLSRVGTTPKGWAGPSLINQQSGQYPTNMPTGQFYGSNSFSEILSSQVFLGLCQVDRKKKQHNKTVKAKIMNKI